jgi:membrane-bound ClpP family serine protease
MEIFLNPNVGYLILVGGLVLSILALFAPGSGILELGALGLLVLAWYILSNLLVNTWAVIVLVLGMLSFGLALRLTKGRQYLIFLLIAVASLIVGSIFVYRNAQGGPAVNPWLAIVVTGSAAVLMWFIAQKSLEAAARKPIHNPDHVAGTTGLARTDLRPEGTVYVGGEEWSALAKETIPAGTPVRVLRRNGLILEVEKVKKEE